MSKKQVLIKINGSTMNKLKTCFIKIFREGIHNFTVQSIPLSYSPYKSNKGLKNEIDKISQHKFTDLNDVCNYIIKFIIEFMKKYNRDVTLYFFGSIYNRKCVRIDKKGVEGIVHIIFQTVEGLFMNYKQKKKKRFF